MWFVPFLLLALPCASYDEVHVNHTVEHMVDLVRIPAKIYLKLHDFHDDLETYRPIRARVQSADGSNYEVLLSNGGAQHVCLHFYAATEPYEFVEFSSARVCESL